MASVVGPACGTRLAGENWIDDRPRSSSSVKSVFCALSSSNNRCLHGNETNRSSSRACSSSTSSSYHSSSSISYSCSSHRSSCSSRRQNAPVTRSCALPLSLLLTKYLPSSSNTRLCFTSPLQRLSLLSVHTGTRSRNLFAAVSGKSSSSPTPATDDSPEFDPAEVAAVLAAAKEASLRDEEIAEAKAAVAAAAVAVAAQEPAQNAQKGALVLSRRGGSSITPWWQRIPGLGFLMGKGRDSEEVPLGSSLEAEALELIEETGVVVVGAGLAGLCAARELHRADIPFILCEASDGVGGRVRTDEVDGFLLDRGFQIFLSAYPTAKEILDYKALELKPFYAGALVWFDGQFHRVADPFRHPLGGVASLFNPIGFVQDKILVGLLRLNVLGKSLEEILEAPEVSIEARLKEEGFSPQMIDRFFRPFLGGIFFDRELSTTSRLLEFVLRMLALGQNTLPAAGIGAIPEQIAATLPDDSIRLNSPVETVKPQVEPNSNRAMITMSDGKKIKAEFGVILAVEAPVCQKLLDEAVPESYAKTPSKEGTPRSTTCLYFTAPKAPRDDPVLYLNGTEKGIVNNLCFPSTVSTSYAPADQTLVSVSLIGTFDGFSDGDLEMEVREEVAEWFGKEEVDTWKHLRTYRIPFAQPDQRPPTNFKRTVRVHDGVYVCGDHRDGATFDGAMLSGRRAARELIDDVGGIYVE